MLYCRSTETGFHSCSNSFHVFSGSDNSYSTSRYSRSQLSTCTDVIYPLQYCVSSGNLSMRTDIKFSTESGLRRYDRMPSFNKISYKKRRCICDHASMANKLKNGIPNGHISTILKTLDSPYTFIYAFKDVIHSGRSLYIDAF